MPHPFIFAAIPVLCLSTLLMAHPVFAESSTPLTPHPKSIPLQSVAEKQSNLTKAIVILDAKFSDKASSSTNKNTIDQASLIHQASTEASQAADHLTQAAVLSKNSLQSSS
jgi:hypothetical protein